MRSARRGIQRAALKNGGPGERIPGDLRRRFGEWLKDARVAAGFTQTEFVAAVGLPGVTGNVLSAIENGRGNVPQEYYSAYAEALGLTREEFAKIVLRHVDPWIYQALTKSRDRQLLDEIALMQKGHFRRTSRDGDAVA